MKKINSIYNVLKSWDKITKGSAQIHYVRKVGKRNPEEYATVSSYGKPVFVNYEDSMKNSILITLYPGRIRGFLIDAAYKLNIKPLQGFLMKYPTDMEVTITGHIYQIPKDHLFYGVNHLHLESLIMFEKEEGLK